MMGLKLHTVYLNQKRPSLLEKSTKNRCNHLKVTPKLQNHNKNKLKSIEDVPKAQPALMAPPIQAMNAEIQPHAQDQPVDFDILDLLSDCVDDKQLVLAATQVEAQVDNNSMTKTKLMERKNSPKKPQIFSGCTIGSIGILNIHIHKN